MDARLPCARVLGASLPHTRRLLTLQPTLEEAEGIRDSLIAHMFDELGQKGLDADHPMGAYGQEAQSNVSVQRVRTAV